MSAGRFSLAGRRALVTGASAGIGRAVAMALAEHGAELVLHHFADADGAAGLADSVGGALCLEADFTSAHDTTAFADRALAAGPIDILIWNAAIERRGPWDRLAERDIADTISANFSAFLTVAGALVPQMAARGWGRVVATGSVLSARPRAETVVYAALKSAQRTAVRAIAREVAASGVTMNIVSPGAIETEANAHRYADGELRRKITAKIPAGRHGRPDDLAGAYVFLCSDGAAYVTGADIPIDGGWSIGDAPEGSGT
ncbi:SDR family NAD(P)-dependent oxidoreductase [Aureimonas frigidaquae]|uniref:SDR family NAD(P)-dependent oxidoreductase n=1 Tax=Aureimonas frigidaquae TaxID=424757 RepID=UPI000780F44C|nr:SDR family oxidoreductase [Aureimonas frigidaquae]